MKPLYTDSEFKNTKSIDKLPCQCYYCGSTFLKIKHDIVKYLNKTLKSGNIKYCSKKCFGHAKNIKKTLTCEICNITFQRSPSEINKHNFCSNSCKGAYHNANKKHGSNRSKLEKYIETQLGTLYPNLDIDYNKTKAIGSELDIYIPSLQLAFELNGIFHYEPIFGSEKLTKTQETDSNKFLRCQLNNISLCIIDTSSQKYFKESTSKKYLDIIINIINQRTTALIS